MAVVLTFASLHHLKGRSLQNNDWAFICVWPRNRRDYITDWCQEALWTYLLLSLHVRGVFKWRVLRVTSLSTHTIWILVKSQRLPWIKLLRFIEVQAKCLHTAACFSCALLTEPKQTRRSARKIFNSSPQSQPPQCVHFYPILYLVCTFLKCIYSNQHFHTNIAKALPRICAKHTHMLIFVLLPLWGSSICIMYYPAPYPNHPN